ncbi:MAG: fumarylacetoacetate hydrolase [Deltaproteobacteria bacterium]|nr:fumarylacetoacetate hydrolase [Deltaproteobacteria bacterium]
MRILRFNDDRIGVLNEGSVVDVSEAVEYRVEKGPQRVIEEILERFIDYRKEFELLAKRGKPVALNELKLLAPIPRPSKCLAAFSNYLDRPDRKLDQMHLDFFYKAPELVGPEQIVELPDIPAVMVYQAEAELAFVIGKRGKNINVDRALDHVFGYVPFFDISARGLTRRTQFIPKGQDTHGPCGPWLATKDEIPDPHNLNVRSWINGEKRQDFNTRHMAHKIPELIAWVSKFVQLCPGDVIATGTHHEGLAAINDGDVLEIEVEGIGKTKFSVKGYGARKDMEFVPGKTPVPRPSGNVSAV